MAQPYPPQYPQYPPPYPQYPPPAPSTSGAAVVSLIFSILGIIGFLPLLGSLVGIIAGNSAKGDIRRRPGQVTGEGMAQAGVIIGWIGLILWGLGACVFLLFFGGTIGLSFCAVLGSGGRTSMLPLLPSVPVMLTSLYIRLSR